MRKNHYIGDGPVEVPDLLHPVVGFRAFQVRNEQVVSPFRPQCIWASGTMTAECLPFQTPMPWGVPFTWAARRQKEEEHTAPDQDCQCGFYMYFAFDDALDHHRGDLMGLVSATGVMQVHKTGLRAQYMQLHALCRLDKLFVRIDDQETRIVKGRDAKKLAKGLAKETGVPLVSEAELIALSGEFGQPIPESCLPDDETNES